MAFKIVPASHEHYAQLTAIYKEIVEVGADEFFHPHPFTQRYAIELLNSCSKDVYLLALSNGQTLAYGMLRGWNDGYDTPFLGIYVAREARGTGMAQLMMESLRFAAQAKGAAEIRLKVHQDNIPAIRLYESLGYKMSKFDEHQLIGVLSIKGSDGRHS